MPTESKYLNINAGILAVRRTSDPEHTYGALPLKKLKVKARRPS